MSIFRFQKEFTVAKELILKTGNYLKINFSKKHQQFRKNKFEITISEDKEAEKILISGLLKKFPHSHILSEEAGSLGNAKAETGWIIDPLDGTTNYAFQLPFFCTQLAFVYQQQLIFSLLFAPMFNDCLWAIKDQGAYLNNRKLFIKLPVDRQKTYLCFSRGHSLKAQQILNGIFVKVTKSVRSFRVFGSSGFSLMLLCQNRNGALIDIEGQVWDVAPGVLGVREAGGIAYDINGNQWSLKSNSLICGDIQIVTDLLKLIAD